MSRWRWMSVLAVAMLGAALLGPAAAGSVTNVKSTVTIASGEGAQFTGKVSAGKQKCRAGRTVRLYTEAGSTAARPGDQLVGTAKTDANGNWTIDGSFYAAVYYTQVAAILIHIHGVAYRCLGDFSPPGHF